MRISRLIVHLTMPLLLAGCNHKDDTAVRACVEEALRQPDLKNGVALFATEHGGLEEAAISWRGRLRLLSKMSYPVASLTKLVVAADIQRLKEAGIIDLDMPAETLLPDYDFLGENTSEISVINLLQHTAGFFHPWGNDPLFFRGDQRSLPSCTEASQYLLGFPANNPPGEFTHYSNVGYCLLGEILLRNSPQATAHNIIYTTSPHALRSQYGGAGGWVAPLQDVFRALQATLPLHQLPAPPAPLPDGSWYSYGWRWWPEPQAGAEWTHTGRLPGLLAIALSDGRGKLIVAYFDGDPPDYHQSTTRFGREAWACLE